MLKFKIEFHHINHRTKVDLDFEKEMLDCFDKILSQMYEIPLSLQFLKFF